MNINPDDYNLNIKLIDIKKEDPSGIKQPKTMKKNILLPLLFVIILSYFYLYQLPAKPRELLHDTFNQIAKVLKIGIFLFFLLGYVTLHRFFNILCFIFQFIS